MAHNLVQNYGLYKFMDICKPPKASANDMTKFHSDDYIDFLRRISPDNVAEYAKQAQRCMHTLLSSFLAFPFQKRKKKKKEKEKKKKKKRRKRSQPFFPSSSVVNVGEDCPVFDGLYEFCQISAGGSIGDDLFLFFIIRPVPTIFSFLSFIPFPSFPSFQPALPS